MFVCKNFPAVIIADLLQVAKTHYFSQDLIYVVHHQGKAHLGLQVLGRQRVPHHDLGKLLDLLHGFRSDLLSHHLFRLYLQLLGLEILQRRGQLRVLIHQLLQLVKLFEFFTFF